MDNIENLGTQNNGTSSQSPQPNRYMQALPSRPANMGVQKGRLGVGTGGKLSFMSQVNLSTVLAEYQETYTDTCFRRTGPYGGTMPLSYERWLRAVDLATSEKNMSGSVRAKVAQVASYYGQLDKNSDSAYINLCRMTAEPFPLVSSGRAATGESMKSKSQPLIDQQTLFATSQRYARVMLSELGKIATRWYKNYKMTEFDQHKSIVPLSLFRKTHVWTLGFRTEMRPLNPSEVFRLMARLIENFDMSTGVRHDLSDADISEYFRGPDLGDGYIIFMTDESLMSLYSAGKSSITVVPDIVLNADDRTIVFQRPILDKPSKDLAKYFLVKLQTKMKTNDRAPIYQSFTYDDVDVNGQYVTLKNCNFMGNYQETIKAELWCDVNIQKTTVLTNTILIPGDEKVQSLGSRDGIHYKVDCKSIPETLWMHIDWEKDRQLKNFYDRKRYLEGELRTSKLLEKVTRPPVAEYVHSIMKSPNRITDLLLMLGQDVDTELKRTAFHDGVWFSKDEAEEIFRERVGSTTIGGSRIQILAILFKRDDYKDLWMAIENELAEIQKIIDNPLMIYNIIYRELVDWTSREEWKRKSQVYFLADTGAVERGSKDSIVYYTAPNPKFDELNMPCSIYYNNKYMARSFGANMNIILDDAEKIPTKVLNVTTEDYVGVLHGKGVTYLKATAVPTSSYAVGDVIKSIIPYSGLSRLLLNIVRYDTKPDGQPFMKECYYRIVQPGALQPNPVSGIQGLDVNEFIEGIAYLDTGATHLDIRTTVGLKRVDIKEIPAVLGSNAYPIDFGIVTDVREVFDINESYPIMYAGYTDQVLERTKTTAEFTEVSWGDGMRVLNGEYGPKFADHVELYYHTLYLHNWLDINFIIEQRRGHGKKSIITENRWIRSNDATSRLISKKITALNTQEKGVGQRLIHCYCSQGYRDWNVHLLSDWSLIDQRFGCGTVRPDDERVMKVYLNYMADRFNGTVTNPELPVVTIGRMNLSEVNLTQTFDERNTWIPEDSVTVNDNHDEVKELSGELSAADEIATENQLLDGTNDINIE